MRQSLVKKSRVGIWYRFLRAAQRMKLDIDWSLYEDWGGQTLVMRTPFEVWWKSRGRALFPRRDREIVVTDNGDSIVVSIPKSYTVRELRRDLGRRIKPYLRKGGNTELGRLAPIGLMRYAELVRYLRLLEIDLTPDHHHKTMKEKLRALEALYKKQGRRITSQRAKIAVEFSNQRLGYLWLKNAKQIAKNVAAGAFPGTAYRRAAG